MKIILIVALIGFLAIQSMECRPKASQAAKANTAQTVQEGDITKKTEELIKSFEEIGKGNLPNSQQIIENIESTGEKIASGIKELNAALTKKISENQGTIDSSIQKVVTELQSLEKRVLGPNGEKKATELKETLNQKLKEVTTQLDTLKTKLQPEAEKIKKDFFSAVEIFLDKTKEASASLEKIVAEAKAH